MPRIPTVQSNGNLPQQGVPRGTAGTPSVQQPFAPQGLGQGTAQGITQTGSALADLAEAGKHARRAQDVLDSTQQAQEYELAMQARFAELSQGDFRTLPEDTVQAGRDLIKEMRQGLNNQAGQRFETQAVDFLGNLQAKALGVRTARREEQKVFVAQRGVDMHVRGLAEASDSAEAEYHRAALLTMFQDGIDSGLWHGKSAAELHQKSIDDAKSLRWQAQIQLYPEASEAALRAKAKAGETMVGNVPIANLIDKAHAERMQIIKENEELERTNRLQLQRTQEGHEARLANRVDTADSVNELQAIERVIRRMGEDPTEGGLTLSSFNRLRSDIAAKKKALLEAQEGISDQATLNNYRLAVFGGRGLRNSSDTMHLRKSLYDSMDVGLLTWKDVKDLVSELNNEQDNNYYTKAVGYSQAERDLDHSLNTTNPFQEFDPRGEALRVIAKREFNDRIYEVWTQGGNVAVNKELRSIQRDVENTYAEQTLKAVRNALQIPPRELPSDILDETGLNEKSTTQEIQQRFEAARQRLISMQRSGNVRNPAQLERWIVALDQRARWWGLVTGVLTTLPFRARGTTGGGTGQFEQQRR